MITRYEISLCPDQHCIPRLEWGYRLYSALLNEASDSFGASVHQDTVTPLSQFLLIEEQKLTWVVNLLGSESEKSLSGLIEGRDSFYLRKDQVNLKVTCCIKKQLMDIDELFARTYTSNGGHLLQFQTPTAFKSRGQYRNIPTERLIMQSLINKWNGCFPECPIEDEDGQGMEAIAAGISFRRFQLQDGTYHLKRTAIPGFTGELYIENQLSGFHRDLAEMLLAFAEYSGVGIKTALGMGGILHQYLPERNAQRSTV